MHAYIHARSVLRKYLPYTYIKYQYFEFCLLGICLLAASFAESLNILHESCVAMYSQAV